MVVTLAPLTLPRVVLHERTALPLTCTVHAPHCAMPQPNLVPGRFSSSRITHRSGVLSSDCAETGFPLRVNETIEASLSRDLQPTRKGLQSRFVKCRCRWKL